MLKRETQCMVEWKLLTCTCVQGLGATLSWLPSHETVDESRIVMRCKKLLVYTVLRRMLIKGRMSETAHVFSAVLYNGPLQVLCYWWPVYHAKDCRVSLHSSPKTTVKCVEMCLEANVCSYNWSVICDHSNSFFSSFPLLLSTPTPFTCFLLLQPLWSRAQSFRKLQQHLNRDTVWCFVLILSLVRTGYVAVIMWLKDR